MSKESVYICHFKSCDKERNTLTRFLFLLTALLRYVIILPLVLISLIMVMAVLCFCYYKKGNTLTHTLHKYTLIC